MASTIPTVDPQLIGWNPQAIVDKLTAVRNAAVVDVEALQASSTALDWKNSVRVASAASIANLSSVTVANFDGTGQGITLVAGNRVLVKDNASSNGVEATHAKRNWIYVVGTVAAGAAPLTRAADADASAEVTSDCAVMVSEGTYAGRSFYISTADPITLDTTGITVSPFAAGLAQSSDVTSLTTRVSTEESTRGSADTSLTTRVSTAESTEASTTTSLTTRVSTEESTRTSADTSLTTRVSTEESSRTSGDLSITTRINVGQIGISLFEFREVDGSGDVTNLAGGSGVLASDTTPVLRADVAESHEIVWVAGNTDIISIQKTLPSNFNGAVDATLDLWVYTDNTGGGGIDPATFTVESSWDGGALVTDTATDSVPATSVHKITATIAAADIPDAASYVTIHLTLGAHAADPVQLVAARLNFAVS